MRTAGLTRGPGIACWNTNSENSPVYRKISHYSLLHGTSGAMAGLVEYEMRMDIPLPCGDGSRNSYPNQ